jgi:hypothetical protein
VTALALASLFALAGCGAADHLGRPLATPLASVQSGTLRIQLHQVMVLTLSGDERYTAQIADPTVVAVVEHHDAAAGRFEPELVPLKPGVTQVALTSSRAGHEVVGFRVIVTAPPVERALGAPY